MQKKALSPVDLALLGCSLLIAHLVIARFTADRDVAILVHFRNLAPVAGWAMLIAAGVIQLGPPLMQFLDWLCFEDKFPSTSVSQVSGPGPSDPDPSDRLGWGFLAMGVLLTGYLEVSVIPPMKDWRIQYVCMLLAFVPAIMSAAASSVWASKKDLSAVEAANRATIIIIAAASIIFVLAEIDKGSSGDAASPRTRNAKPDR